MAPPVPLRTRINATDLVTFGGPEPAELFDAGEWLRGADLTATNVPRLAARRALAIKGVVRDGDGR